MLLQNGDESAMPHLNTTHQEADFAVPLHVLDCIKAGYLKILVLSNDTDIDVILLYLIPVFLLHGMKELWIQAGVGHSARYVPLHILHTRMGMELCEVLPALYTLTGCDSTSKIGTKKAALESDPTVLLKDFGKDPELSVSTLQQAEKFLVKVLKKSSTSTNFTDLRKEIYRTSSSRTHTDLPPTSDGLLPHIKRAHFGTYMITHLLTTGSFAVDISPLDNGYELTDGSLTPAKSWKLLEPKWTVVCKCTKCARITCPCTSQNIPCVTFCGCKASLDCRNPLTN